MSDSDSTRVELERRISELEQRLDDTVVASDLDAMWVIISAVLVFFMQVGFAMVSSRINIYLLL